MLGFKSVDTVLKNFNKIIEDLDAIEQRELTNVTFFKRVAETNLANAEAAGDEAKRARKAADKIRGLLA
jgi:methanogenic corrinoid protein MtbC1